MNRTSVAVSRDLGVALTARVVTVVQAKPPAVADVLSAGDVFEVCHGVVVLVAGLMVDLRAGGARPQERQRDSPMQLYPNAAAIEQTYLELPVALAVAVTFQDATALSSRTPHRDRLAADAAQGADAVQPI